MGHRLTLFENHVTERKNSNFDRHFQFLTISSPNFTMGDEAFSFPTLIRKDSNVFVKKPLPAPVEEVGEKSALNPGATLNSYESFNDSDESVSSSQSLERHLTLTDLVLIGIGGTIGSGLFVLCGLISNQYAGPATAISWAISGLAALLSGCCYAELSSRIPLSGSAYAYTFVAMGELPALLAAACLSLEYIAAASAVSRSWGDKIVAWVTDEFGPDHWSIVWYDIDGVVSPFAFVVSAGSVLLLANGVKESKFVTNAFTGLKVLLVVFMIVVGSFYIRPSNWTPFIPPQFGASGVLRGATGTFFGYLGYDEIACLGAEAQNPKRNLPKAILYTIGSVTTLYILATLSLTGMVPYEDISPVSGFPAAFHYNNALLAAEIAALGEIITLPIVVLITIMAQPRLQYALAKDGLLPPIFGELDSKGNMTSGTIICGVLMVLIATFVPFDRVNDMISCAVLTALSLTDTSLILLWHPSPKQSPGLAESVLGVFHLASLMTSILLTHFLNIWYSGPMATAFTLVMILCVLVLYRYCPRTPIFGSCSHSPLLCEKSIAASDDGYFQTPFVPVLPCIGILVNWYLISQLELVGILLHLGIMALSIVYYFAYAIHTSVGNNGGWTTSATTKLERDYGDDSRTTSAATSPHGSLRGEEGGMIDLPVIT